MNEQDNKNSAVEQAELSINGFYIEIAEKRVQEIQAEIDNGTVTGQAIFNAQAIIRAYNKRLLELRTERQAMRWQVVESRVVTGF